MPITVREVLQSAAAMLGDGQLAAAAEGKEGDELSLLIRCFNLVENEVALDYIPLKKREAFTPEEGAIAYSRFAEAPVDILSVKSNGRAVRFERMPGELLPDCSGEAEVTYAFAPRSKTADDNSDYDGKVSARLLALGVATEYLLAAGRYSEAAVFEKRYREALRAANIVRHKLTVRARRWA